MYGKPVQAGLIFVSIALLAACGQEPEPRADTDTSAPAVPGQGEGSAVDAAPATPEAAAPVSQFSPENLVDLTPEQLTDLFEIKADTVTTPEEYAAAFTERYAAHRMAGCTEAEWAPYASSGRGEFEAAMLAEYHAPISEGLYGYEVSSTNQEVALNRCNVMTLLGNSYLQSAEIVDNTIVYIERPDGSFDVSFDLRTTDNYESPRQTANTEPLDYTTTWSFANVRPNAEGALYADTITDVAAG
jgi:hypothetical protein